MVLIIILGIFNHQLKDLICVPEIPFQSPYSYTLCRLSQILFRHCLYGLDADLIMLGLCSHDPHFSLLREEVKFGGKKSQGANKRIPTPEETTFHLLHLSLLREYLDYEFQSLKCLDYYDLENVIDDWVLMGFLVGNDFIPHLPNTHINKGRATSLKI